MSAPAERRAEPRRETPRQHLERVRRDVREGRLRPQDLIAACNRDLPPASASRALAAVLRPELLRS